MIKTKIMAILMVAVMLLGAFSTARAAPPMPSSFFGEIHFQSEDGAPSAGSTIDAYVNGILTPAASATITTYLGNLVYAINVPGDDLASGPIEGGTEDGLVTFKFGTRVVATGVWHEGSNVQLNFHPPKANAGGPYVKAVNTAFNFAGSATDWLVADTFTYAWDLDGDGAYDDSTDQNPSHTFTSTGTKTVGVKVTDSLGGEGTAAPTVIIYSLGGLTGQVYDGNPHAITVDGVVSPYTYEVTYDGSTTAPTDAGSYPVVVTVYDGALNVVDTINDTLVIAKATATVNLGSLNQTYDGTPKPATATTDPVGLTVTFTYNGEATAPTAANSYAVVATVVNANYEGIDSGTLVIGKASSTTTVSGGGTYVYDGLAHAATVSVTGAGGLSLTPAPVYSGACTAAPVNVADTPCTASYTYAGDANHTGSSDTTSITISKKDASVTPAVAGKTYGDTEPSLTGSLDGFVPGDGVTAEYSRVAGEDAGEYTISAVLSPSGALGNYNITYNTAIFTIAKASSTTTISGGGTYVYDGLAHAATVSVTGAGGLSLTPAPVYSGACTAAPVNVADTPCTASYTYAGDANHTGSSDTTSITISKKDASVTPAAAGKTYGDAEPSLTGDLDGFVPGDGVTAVYSRVAGEDAGEYTISAVLSPSGALGNYNITYNTAIFTIAKASSTTTVSGGGTYVYDGLVHAATVSVTGAGGLSLTPAPVYSGACTAAPVNVADTPCTASFTYAGDANHNGSSDTTSITISKKDASVTPAAAGKTYGDAEPSLTGSLDGFVPGDGVTAEYSRVAGEDAGEYTISAVLSPSGALGNYNITYNTAIFTIGKASSMTTVSGGGTYAYDGLAHAATVSVTGAGGLSLTPAPVYSGACTAAPVNVADTPCTASYTYAGDANHNGSSDTTSITISKKDASVTPAAAGKTYGDAEPSLTGDLDGFVPGDGVTAVYSRVAGEDAGEYTISAVLSPSGALGNYNITYNTAIFTIAKASSTTTVSGGGTYVYDGLVHAATVSVTGAGGLSLTPAPVYSGACTAAPVNVADTPCTASFTYAGDANHNGSSDTTSITISKKDASVTPAAAGKTYGDAEPSLTGSLDGFVPGDGVTAEYSRVAGEDAGEYTISAVLSPSGALGNYNITYNTAIFTITKATATVTLANLTQNYDGSAKPATATTSPEGLTVIITYNGSTTAPTDVGTYAVVATIDETNYTGSNSGTLAILAAHSVTLKPGWNLVSFNLQPYTSTTPAVVLASIEGYYSLVLAWDGTGAHAASSGNWLSYDNNPLTTDTLVSMNAYQGFWIYITGTLDRVFTVAGLPATTNINVYTGAGGWNLIGYPSSDSDALPAALSSLGTDYTLVYAYHASDSTDPWKLHDRSAPPYANDLVSMEPGWGYWIKVTANHVLVVAY